MTHHFKKKNGVPLQEHPIHRNHRPAKAIGAILIIAGFAITPFTLMAGMMAAMISDFSGAYFFIIVAQLAIALIGPSVILAGILVYRHSWKGLLVPLIPVLAIAVCFLFIELFRQ